MAFRKFLAAAKLAARAADDKKASDILVFDAKKTSGLADYYVLASVDSSVQLSAVADHVARRLREEYKLHFLHKDGRRSDHWAAMDFGGLLVHVLRRESREFYALERLWEGARRVSWEEKPPARRVSR
jgi:ribosome-associated protein